MTIKEDYFNWLCDQIADQDFHPERYQLLLGKLYHTAFRYVISNDKNRIADGLDLRSEYADETEQDDRTIRIELNFPCSILEMMIALAKRCEYQIMIDLRVGPRVGRWFKEMLTSLGVVRDVDILYDEDYVDFVIEDFLDRKYERNGDGGLFRIDGVEEDMREVEIWYQMNLYLVTLEQD